MSLPPLCVKTGQPAEAWIKRRLIWTPLRLRILGACGMMLPVLGWKFGVPVSWMIGGAIQFTTIAAVLAFSPRETIEVGLSQEWFRRRTRWFLLASFLGAAGVGLIAASLLSHFFESYEFDEIFPGAFLLIAASFCLQRSSMVNATRITKTHVWLDGVHFKVIKSLPAWPGEKVLAAERDAAR